MYYWCVCVCVCVCVVCVCVCVCVLCVCVCVVCVCVCVCVCCRGYVISTSTIRPVTYTDWVTFTGPISHPVHQLITPAIRVGGDMEA